ncbi:rod shape-determining protein MreC [Candidatus Parcubacteria bacterium]|nr:MAG: rod shape-determining protein MreC [Candidatus Parcubacteria bacterium]
MKIFSFKVKFPFLIAAAFLLLIFFHYTGILSPAKDFTIKIFSPIQAKITRLALYINGKLSSNDEITTENYKKLEEKLVELSVENARLQLLEEENEQLKNQLKVVQNLGKSFVSCRIIGKDTALRTGLFNLNCGIKDNVTVGLPVISSQGVFIGRIYQTESRISQLMPVTDPKIKIGAAILNDEQTMGIITGRGDGLLKMEYIPKGVKIDTEMLAVTSELEINTPKDLLIGSVVESTADPNNFFQSAVIKPSFEINDLTVVTVILP